MKYSTRILALIASMSALGNALGFLGIRLPSAPGTTVEFHLSALPSLLVAVAVGPIEGALTGLLSLVMATLRIGNIFIPFGNALLAGIAGLLAKKFKFSPPVCGAIAIAPYAPYIWFACAVYSVPPQIISFIIMKAFIEILISGIIVEVVLSRVEVRAFLSKFTR